MSYGSPWDRWEAAAKACRDRGGDVQALSVDPRASESNVLAVEKELGQPIPLAMRQVLLQFSRRVGFRWSLPGELEPPAPYDEIFAGECCWDLQELAAHERKRGGWIENCFPNPDDSYDRIWHNKLGLASVGNGDVIAFDLQVEARPVVYLSHDDGEGRGRVMGTDFISFIDQHTLLGCVGLEDWHWLPFASSQRCRVGAVAVFVHAVAGQVARAAEASPSLSPARDTVKTALDASIASRRLRPSGHE